MHITDQTDIFGAFMKIELHAKLVHFITFTNNLFELYKK